MNIVSMNRCAVFAVVVCSLVVSAPNPCIAAPPPPSAEAQAAKAAAAAIKQIETEYRKKQYVNVIAAAKKTLDDPGVSNAQRGHLLARIAQSTEHLKDATADDINAAYENIVRDAKVPNRAKIDALKQLADFYIDSLSGKNLDAMDLSPAHAILTRALKLPELTAQDRAMALTNIGRLYDREVKYEEARKAYGQVLSLDVSDRTKLDADRAIAAGYAREGNAKAALAIYQKHGLSLIGLYQQLGKTHKADEACYDVLNDAKASDTDRWNAFRSLSCWNWREHDPQAVVQVCNKYLPSLMKKDPNRATIVWRKFRTFANGEYPNFVIWATPMLLDAPRFTGKNKLEAIQALLDAQLALGQKRDAAKTAQLLIRDEKAPAAVRFETRIAQAVLISGGQHTQDMDKLVASANRGFDAKSLSNKAKAEAILAAAKTALRAGNTDAAKGLYKAYQDLFVAKPGQASIQCAYVDSAPFDVSAWLMSPIVKSHRHEGHLDRPYGDNLKFLLATDSSGSGRNIDANAKDDASNNTDFYVVCDSKGIHLFFMAYDNQVQQVLDGLVRGGGYEIYLAPGAHQAYYDFMPSLPSGRVDPQAFVTMYPNAHFRLPSEKDGTFQSETRPTANGFATDLFMSWTLFYDNLPTNGMRWQLGAIRWTRSGGLSFGGSQSVHNRSSWGDIVFSGLTPNAMTAIKRNIIYQAAAKYKRTRRSLNGPVSVWSDPVLGDVAFYNEKVKPIVDKLNEDMKAVTDQMSDAEVDQLFAEAVPGWMDLSYRVATLRREYLRMKLLHDSHR